MPWPLSQDYNEAIQTPTQCFNDPELQRGEAVTNELGLPMPCSGNFADVYAVQAGQHKWAVKCFTRQIQGLRERYAEISKYLHQVQLPFMVEFKFLDQGIRVRGQWYPILKMQWVEGLALNAFVRANADNPAILQSVCQIWVRMAARLREANLAHGDLQHGNVLLVQGAKAGTAGVKLVDYDGMCVPALEFLKATEVGHPAYQHPQRLRDASYGLHIDNFSHLVIYTALRALTVGGKKLWDRFDNGDNLLFSQKDFENPNGSPVFKELLAQSDGEVRKLTGVLAEAARQPVEQVPQLEDVLPNGSRPKTAIPKQVVARPADLNPFVPPGTPARSRKKQGGKGVLAAVLIGCLVMAGVAVGAFLLSQGPPQPSSPVAVNDSKRIGTPLSTKALIPQTNAASETTVTNSIGMKFVLIPSGKFLMGSPDVDPQKRPDEVPQHEVRITAPFYLSANECTVGQFRAFVKDADYATEPERTGSGGHRWNGKEWQLEPSCTWKTPGWAQSDQHPVVCVTWNDAIAFCNWLSKKEGKVYRLPTEAEWEYACRAGTTTVTHEGASIPSGQARFRENANSPMKPDQVASYKANSFGLHDMHGNVWELCFDKYDPRYYQYSRRDNPCGPKKLPSGDSRVMRGASWFDNPLRSALRWEVGPGHAMTHLGFRVIMESDAGLDRPLEEDTRRGVVDWSDIERLDANGLKVAGELNCAKSAYRYSVGGQFRVDSDWLFHIEFLVPRFPPQGQIVMVWGDDRIGHDPISVVVDKAVLQIGIDDCIKNKRHGIVHKMPPESLNSWTTLVVRYEAKSRIVEAYINNNRIVREECIVVPSNDRPQPIWIGGGKADWLRFFGKVRRVWLGNL